MRKTIIIGLDGATFGVLDPYMKAGELPNIKRMCDSGFRGELRSSIPPVTGPSWVSFLTGKNPGKHGIFDFVRAGENEIRRQPVNYRHIRSKTILNLANEAGRKVGIVNMPLTYPPPEIDGFVVTGLLTPGDAKNISYPAGLIDELNGKLGPYKMDVLWQFYGEAGVEKFLDEVLLLTEQRCKVFEHLMEEKEWDLFIAVFIGSDRIQHFLWKYIHPQDPGKLTAAEKRFVSRIKEYYRMVDRYMGMVLDRYGKDCNILMVSDHGFGPLVKKFYINRWLFEKGYLSLNNAGGGVVGKGIAYARKAIRRLDRTNVRRLIPAGIRARKGFDLFSSMNMPLTRAYSASNTEQGIYLNLKGREPGGVINPGQEYELLRDEIIRELRRLRDPQTGEVVISHIHKREDIYTGPYVTGAPDIIFFVQEGAYLADVQLKTSVFGDADWASGWGTHRMDGIVLGCGPDIKKGERIEGAHIMDIAPTVLRLMEIPVPYDMDGKVLNNIIENEFLTAHREEFADDKGLVIDSRADSVLSEDDKEEVANRLKGLGYL